MSKKLVLVLGLTAMVLCGGCSGLALWAIPVGGAVLIGGRAFGAF